MRPVVKFTILIHNPLNTIIGNYVNLWSLKGDRPSFLLDFNLHVSSGLPVELSDDDNHFIDMYIRLYMEIN